jgi:hypothetical protein
MFCGTFDLLSISVFFFRIFLCNIINEHPKKDLASRSSANTFLRKCTISKIVKKNTMVDSFGEQNV